MSENKLVFTGLEAFKADLRNLPRDLTGEAAHIVIAHANRAALAVRQQYHIGKTGDLVEHVVVNPLEASEFAAVAKVVSNSNLAFIYEEGTVRRDAVKRHGKPMKKKANRGSSPKHPIFIAEMMRERAAMEDDLADMMRQHGLTVHR
jgi:hypothetical protein